MARTKAEAGRPLVQTNPRWPLVGQEVRTLAAPVDARKVGPFPAMVLGRKETPLGLTDVAWARRPSFDWVIPRACAARGVGGVLGRERSRS